jgi:hypothetical protein
VWGRVGLMRVIDQDSTGLHNDTVYFYGLNQPSLDKNTKNSKNRPINFFKLHETRHKKFNLFHC